MINYDISKLIGRSGGQLLMPMIQSSFSTERQYITVMRQTLRSFNRDFRNTLLVSYQRARIVDTCGKFFDTNESEFSSFSNITRALARNSARRINRILQLEALRHTKTFTNSVRKTFGIDISSLISDEDLTDLMDRIALRNAGLITGLTDDLVKKVQTATTNALINGHTVAEYKRAVLNEISVSESRARLIARDQTSKLNSDLNKHRQLQAGIESYTWRTSADERVRARHRKLNGKVYKYGEKTGAENGAEPGQPIQCRCIAQGIVEF